MMISDERYPILLGHALGPRMAAEYIDSQGIEYEDIESRWQSYRHASLRPHGDRTMNQYFACADSITKSSQMAFILAGRGPGYANGGAQPHTQQVLDALPSFDECVKLHHTFDNLNFWAGIISGLGSGLFMKAFVLERLGAVANAEALKHLDVMLSSSDFITGTADPYGQAAALACRGRLLEAAATDGDTEAHAQATVAFEAALQTAEESGRWLLALSIIGDMQRAGVLVEKGAAIEIMGRLVSPPEVLQLFVDVEREQWPSA